MSNLKISQLPQATLPLSGAELIAVVQSGVTKQAAVNDVKYGIVSGHYAPTFASQSNLSALTNQQEASYIRVGNIVTVQFYVNITPTVTLTPTFAKISLPIAASPSGNGAGQGVFADTTGYGAVIVTGFDGTYCRFTLYPTIIVGTIATFSFSYRIA